MILICMRRLLGAVSDISASKRLDQVLGGDAGSEASQQVQDMISDLVRQKLPGVD